MAFLYFGINMRRFVSFILLIISFGAYAQRGSVMHYLMFDGAICYSDGGGYAQFLARVGPELGIGYRADISISEKWSVIPGAGIHSELLFIPSPCITAQTDLFCAAGYHYDVEGVNTVFSFGPNLSYHLIPGRYYIDADPWDVRNGNPIFRRANLSFRTEVFYEGRGRWFYGFGLNIGVHNQRAQYEEFDGGNSRVHYFRVIFGYRL